MMKRIVQTVAALYWIGLTVLLLMPNPGWVLDLVGIKRLPIARPDQGAHFFAFTLLGASVFLAGLPLRAWLVTGLLVGYAVAVEWLQRFVPPRVVDGRDLLANLLGLALGVGLYGAGLAVARWNTRRLDRKADRQFQADPAVPGADVSAVARLSKRRRRK
jgi:hypothetical protein